MNQELIYKKNINKLMSLTNFEYDKVKKRPLGFHLDRVNFMMKTFDYPNRNQKFIHVAGSKGKGSTSNLISNALSEYKVGLFTSPHMHELTERIKINNIPISKKLFNFYFEKVWEIVPIMKKEMEQIPSFFEFITLLAFIVFRDEKTEVSVIEVGLGGRLDSTNVIDSDISVITQISKDHTKILGNNLEKIAIEKSGIIKPKTPVITSKQKFIVEKKIKYVSKLNKSILYKSSEVDLKSRNFQSDGKFKQKIILNNKYKFNLNLVGEHQIENLKTAIKTIQIFKNLKKIDSKWKKITENISKTTMIGRCEILNLGSNYLIADGAQNNKSSKALLKTLKQLNFDISRAIWIYGSTEGHDSKETIKCLKKYNPKIILTKSRIPKSKPINNILKELKGLNLDIIEITNNSAEAYKVAKKISKNNENIIAFGSLYIAAEILELVKKINPEKYNYE
jgi:dihydrofolate synthase / folylpolyglutamate synthase